MLDKFAKKESPIMGYAGFGGGVSSLLTLASGKPTYIEDVFSTYLYNGSNSAQTITNGIDLAGKGGMVWLKSRTGGYNHNLYDTERGVKKAVYPNNANTEYTENSSIGTFNDNGFAFAGGGDAAFNTASATFASWTFRKCPGFFDVVTWTGNGTAGRQISHSLGSVPGCIIIKCTSHSDNWYVHHRSTGATKVTLLNTTNAAYTSDKFNDTLPTSTHFELPADSSTNGSGRTFVAYLFAHNDGSFGEDSDEAVIKCGSYTATGSAQTIDLGFEPQFLITKKSSGTGEWRIKDMMRGITTGGADAQLDADSNSAEIAGNVTCDLTPRGFISNGSQNDSGGTYIYIAIRRPHKPPEAGTDVFAVDTRGSTGDGNEPTYRSTFPVDLQINRNVNYNGGDTQIASRLLQGKQMFTNITNVESGNSTMMFDYMNGVQTDTGTSTDQYAWMFKRAPGFMDMVTYEGTGSSTGIDHNLGVTPEMKIIKNRDSASGDWIVGGTAVAGENGYVYINSSAAKVTSSNYWDGGDDSATKFSVRQGNASSDANGQSYIAILFSTLAGISKVGTYTGTANAINVDCGFTNGARFVLIKRLDSSTGGHWYLFDSLRGINSGNDPYIRLNLTNNQGSADLIDPYNAGFSVASGTTNVNYSGGTYLFLAIA
jgi:hypothetical protein